MRRVRWIRSWVSAQNLPELGEHLWETVSFIRDTKFCERYHWVSIGDQQGDPKQNSVDCMVLCSVVRRACSVVEDGPGGPENERQAVCKLDTGG